MEAGPTACNDMAVGKKTGGRAAGTPNKMSATVKENVIAVFNRLEGTAGMAKWAKENPTAFYQIYSKLLPSEVENKHSGAVTMAHAPAPEISKEEWLAAFAR